MRRAMFLWIGLTVLFAILFLRLIELTFFEGEKNRVLADTQRIKIRKVIAPRGIIYDRKMKPLVFNSPIFRNCPQKGEPCVYLNRETALSLEAQNKDANLVIDIGRKYPLGKATAFVLGYLGEASSEEVQAQKYLAGDFVGRSGLEEQYDNLLRGVDGGELVETNTEGLTVRKIGQKEPVAGLDLVLNLDADLQKVAYEALDGKKGAIVAQNPNTGEVLALVSSPSFDPSDITQKDLLNPDNPLFNRAISGGYPPGSTFKIVASIAALEEKIITADTKIEDTGIIRIGQYSYSNWYFTSRGKTEGNINIVRAIARSTDTFFYKLGEMVGPKKMIEWAKKFGLGTETGIDIPGEIAGLLPNSETGDWFLGNTFHLAIGQGDLNVSPLQINAMTSVVASGGKLCKPKLVHQEKVECTDINIKPDDLKLVVEGMKGACSPGGTAAPLFDYQINGQNIACKTGTAEFNDPKGNTHAWFTAFAPIDKPEISVTVLIEEGGEGSVVAAPMARMVMEEWFRK